LSKLDFRKNKTQYRERIKKHRVCYEYWPDHLMLQGKTAQVGLALGLRGTHGQGIDHPAPGCSRCVRIDEDLRQLAKWAIPQEEYLPQYEIRIYDQQHCDAMKRELRPEAVLRVEVLHRHGTDEHSV